jgi:RNA polymerase sigma factor (sigma-70 family)
MQSHSSIGTSPTLLGRLCRDPSDQAAWGLFVRRYAPLIHGWCCRWHLQPADADEVTQNVLLKLVQKMGTFQYDPSRSFRAWLKTLTHHTWVDFLEAVKARGRGGDDSQMVGPLENLAARDDLTQRLQAEFDHELLEEAMARVRGRVEPQTWEAFRLMSIEGLSGAEAAARLPLSEAMVYVARGRVLRLLREEVRALGGDDAPCWTGCS